MAKKHLKFGLHLSFATTQAGPRGGLALWANRKHELVPGSTRESNPAGHVLGGVYKLFGSQHKAIVIGVYGIPDSNDTSSLQIMQETQRILDDLKFLYGSSTIFVFGDFNAVRTQADTTSPRITKPRTSQAFNDLIDRNFLNDLGLALGKAKHTWQRPRNEEQTSRLDYFLTTAAPQTAKFKQFKTIFDHDMLLVTVNIQPAEFSPSVMQDHVLSSDEFLIGTFEIFSAVEKELGLDPHSLFNAPPPPTMCGEVWALRLNKEHLIDRLRR